MGGKSSTQTATSTSEPWGPQQDYIKQGMAEAQKLYQSSGPSYFPNSTVAGFSGEQNQAMQMGANRALAGSGTQRAANSYAQDVLGGKYLNDPYNDQVFNSIQAKVMPSVNSQFADSGRYGSGLHAGAMTDALTNAYAPYAAQQRQSELGRMDSMAQFAPSLAQADYNDINALGDIGAQKQQLAQSEIQDAMDRYNYNQDLGANKLAQYMGAVGGNWGGTTTSAQPYYRPGLGSQLLGGGLGLLGSLA